MVSKEEPIGQNSSLEEVYNLQQKCRDFLAKIRNIDYDDLIKLAETVGFIFERQVGSHAIYKHPDYVLDDSPPSDLMNFQPINGKAKAVQVRQIIKFIQYAKPKKKR